MHKPAEKKSNTVKLWCVITISTKKGYVDTSSRKVRLGDHKLACLKCYNNDKVVNLFIWHYLDLPPRYCSRSLPTLYPQALCGWCISQIWSKRKGVRIFHMSTMILTFGLKTSSRSKALDVWSMSKIGLKKANICPRKVMSDRRTDW